MPNSNTPTTAAQTKTQMEDTRRNPEHKVGGDGTAGEVVFLTLRFTGGRTIKPKEIYEMLDEKFGTVTSLRSSIAHGNYEFNIES